MDLCSIRAGVKGLKQHSYQNVLPKSTVRLGRGIYFYSIILVHDSFTWLCWKLHWIVYLFTSLSCCHTDKFSIFVMDLVWNRDKVRGKLAVGLFELGVQ